MIEVIIFFGLGIIFILLSLLTLSKKLAFLSFVPFFCGMIAYFSSKRIFLVVLFCILFLIYLFFSKLLLKRSEGYET